MATSGASQHDKLTARVHRNARIGDSASRGRWAEATLGLCAVVLPSLLALAPRGAAPLAAVAGLSALGLIATARPPRFGSLGPPVVVLATLLLWGIASATWSIIPARSPVLAARLAGLFAAALALAAAAPRIAAPWRWSLLLLLGTAIGIAVALVDLASAGGLSRFVTIRPFAGPRLNQVAAWVAIMTLPVTALLGRRGGWRPAVAAGTAMAGAVYLLDDTTAKLALLASLPAAALLYLRRRLVMRLAAAFASLAILAAPITLPRLAQFPAIFARADAFKSSAGHRLLIWSFVGDRIADKPLAGWGLDAARAIPGGKDDFRPGQEHLPLHPHNAALQVWLELGAPGAVLFALLAGWLWLRLGAAAWPRLYAAAAGGAYTAALVVAFSGWGIWEEWWLATLSLAAFAILVMARAIPPPRPPGSPAGDR
ncbi:MAG TPA: O-antigen ligase family protein [Stellaceae bacterium]|nr:O-antigen ligase family protein [Stellaceae bacterium]